MPETGRRVLAALVAAVLWACPHSARAADPSVLFLSSFHPGFERSEMMRSAIQEELARSNRRVTLHFEYLDRDRMPGTPSDVEWATFLAAKYQGAPPDVVIADVEPAIHFAAEYGPRFAGDAPLIGIAPNLPALGDRIDALDVRVTTGRHIDRTVEMALAQRPGATRAIIVADPGDRSLHLARVTANALARYAPHPIAVETRSDYRLEDLEGELAGLPRDSIVFYTHVFEDGTGRRFQPGEVAERLAKTSAAPIYVLFDQEIGTGVVGGYVNSARLAARIAIHAALDLIDGRGPSPGHHVTHYAAQAVIDWRALQRWRIDPDTLPPEAEIRFRSPTLFEAHLEEAIAGLAFIAVLGAALLVITTLFVQRGRLARALQDANSRLEERVAARTRDIERALAGERLARGRLRTFVDMATHEFKTPLATIDSTAQVLELLVDTERNGIGGRLSLIRRSVRRIVDLVETCLAGERFDEEYPVKFISFSPATLVAAVVERQRGLGAGCIVADTIDIPPKCVGDPDLLGIALEALLDNARRYGPADGPIEVTARQDGPVLTLTIADRGPGVPEDEAQRIFEKYYRGNHSRGTPGTGIGLDLVKTIAALHHGTVAHRPRPGGGSLFVLTIPLDRCRHGDRNSIQNASSPG